MLINRRSELLLSGLALTIMASDVGWAQSSLEELPPPAEASVVVAKDRAGGKAELRATQNAMPTAWGLAGDRGRFYFVGGQAFADYFREGERRVVALDEESASPRGADLNYLYYREVNEGHRWAFARSAAQDLRHSVYFQPSGSQVWARFERCLILWDHQSVVAATGAVVLYPTDGPVRP
jgi:hypothetical protein